MKTVGVGLRSGEGPCRYEGSSWDGGGSTHGGRQAAGGSAGRQAGRQAGRSLPARDGTLAASTPSQPASPPQSGTRRSRGRTMELQLISEVSKYPILYDTSLKEYKQVELKNAAWRDISQVLFTTDDPFIGKFYFHSSVRSPMTWEVLSKSTVVVEQQFPSTKDDPYPNMWNANRQ